MNGLRLVWVLLGITGIALAVFDLAGVRLTTGDQIILTFCGAYAIVTLIEWVVLKWKS